MYSRAHIQPLGRSRYWYETKARAYSRRAPVCHYGQEGGCFFEEGCILEGGCFFEEGCILERGAHLQEYGNCGHSASDIQTQRDDKQGRDNKSSCFN